MVTSSVVVRDLSYTAGALALALLVVAAFLLAFLRDRSEVIFVVTPSEGPDVSKTFPATVTLQTFGQGIPFTFTDFVSLVSPVASVGLDTSVTGTPNLTPLFPPGQVPFDSTIGRPLQTPSQGYGWTSFLPSTQQWFVSVENGLSIFGQYFFDAQASSQYDVAQENYTQGNNRILFSGANSSTNQPAVENDTASAVGSVGYASIETSLDGTRLYVGYRQPVMGSAKTSQLLPFQQLVGRVATFTRPITSTAGQTPSSDSQVWSYSDDLSLRNPFGSQAGGISAPLDPITLLPLLSDDFGYTIRTSQNLTNSRRITAVRSNYGYLKQDGAVISITEETKENVVMTSGILQLSDAYAGEGKTFSSNEKLTFGKDFNIADDAVLSAIRVPAAGVSPAVNRVAYFRRDSTTTLWNFQNFIETPDVSEDFGVSIVMCPDARLALIGAPTFPSGRGSGATPGIGGSVYVYQRSDDKKTWHLNQRFSDPFASDHQAGSFGYFVSVDRQFLVAAITANQNNVLDVSPVRGTNQTPVTQKPAVVFVALNQSAGMISSNSPQKLSQPIPTDQFLDPTFGSHLSMEFVDAGRSTLRAVVNSPLNRMVNVFTMEL